ncbi:MAG: hypothetical protein HWE26_16980 [Alteromonadaceae bacterium]|nr:hypothetical protein [Alteromonadaceae bacterium]
MLRKSLGSKLSLHFFTCALLIMNMSSCTTTDRPPSKSVYANTESIQLQQPGVLAGDWYAWGSFTGNEKDSDASILTSHLAWGNQKPLTYRITSADMDADKPDGFVIKLVSQNKSSAVKYTMVDGSSAILQDQGFWIVPPKNKVARGTWEILDDSGQPINVRYTEANSLWNAGPLGPHRLISLLEKRLMLVRLSLVDANVSCSGHSVLSVDGQPILDMWGASQPIYPGNTILVYGRTLNSSVASIAGTGCEKSRIQLNVKVIDSNSLSADLKVRFGI